MAKTNLFMNCYQMPENKLTYNFFCLLEHMSGQKKFLEFVTDGKLPLSEHPLTDIELVLGGYESNPDGLLILKNASGGEYRVYFENKTYRLRLSDQQLRNHLSQHCQDDNCFLLVITPRPQEESIAKSINPEKIFFKTWSQIAGVLSKMAKVINDPFLINQFVEYGKTKGEFEHMELPKVELDDYILSKKNIHRLLDITAKVENKFYSMLESGINDLDFDRYEISVSRIVRRDHYGRLGMEISFTPRQDFGQWIFCGIYYDCRDHAIPFKNNSEPELAFFFDIHPTNRENLKNDEKLIESLKYLVSRNFEENLLDQVTENHWRLLFKRKPLSEIEIFTSELVKDFMEEVLTDLKESGFSEVMM